MLENNSMKTVMKTVNNSMKTMMSDFLGPGFLYIKMSLFVIKMLEGIFSTQYLTPTAWVDVPPYIG